ncbi:MAG: EAL domain-containing protein [Burkholderiaceae bacterium]|nr:EAL domain-containing protein [Burkholderiaceae bacterium]
MNEHTPRARLLLVDDDLILRGMATQTLRHAGFEVTAADCGEEGLRLFADGEFDLLLIDVMMPGLDGFEVCARLRETARGATLPILMLTGLNDTESIETAFRCGATDFVTKPINWTLLGHRVRYSLRASAAAEAAVRNSEHLANAQRLANLGSWEWSIDTEEMTCSRELLRILGREDSSSRTLTAQDLLGHVCESDRHTVRRARDAAAREGEAYQHTFSIERADGQRRTLHEQAEVQRDVSGRIVSVDAVTQDITERVEAEQRIHQLAFYDELTGLANRQLFINFATSALERARRNHGLCAVVHVDLDRFKSVNDALGQDGGNAVLSTLAKRLQGGIRLADVASVNGQRFSSEVVARVGGNAFTILLTDIASNEQAAVVVARLLGAVAQPIEVGEHSLLLTASAGISLFPRDADDAAGLAQKAEQAMYSAKKSGAGQHHFFDEQMNASTRQKLLLGSDLRHAIQAEELCLFVQPQINALTGAMIAAEVLVRWRHPTRGLVLPGEFIPLAEELGLIVRLGDWVVQTACQALQRWGQAGIATVPLAINLSSPSFMQHDLVERLEDVVQRFGIETRQLTLEITESVAMTDIDRAVARLHALRGKGFRLSLDDFGTGFCSLSYLKRFPIHELKIDRAFVRDAANGGVDAAIACSIIELGKQFNLHVIAEGVETAEQSAFLVERGCTAHQGFLYARPMPLEEFEALLIRSNCSRL